MDFFLSEDKVSPPAGEELAMVETGKLRPNPNQPRQDLQKADLDDLARSIQGAGVLQPILARRTGDGLEIVAGERRWRAARRAGLERVPVIVRDLTEEQSAVHALIENVQRTDLNPIEKARAFRGLQDKLACNQIEVAHQVGLERSTVANFMRLLELPEAVQAHVSRGTLTMGHARALLGLRIDEVEKAAEQTIRSRLSVRQVEDLVKRLNENAGAKAKGVPAASRKVKGRPVWVNEIEEALVDALSTPVTVHYGRARSKIVIECAGREEFERVYEKLKGLKES